MGCVWTVAYSPNGQHIVSASFDRTIQIWDAETGAAISTPLEGHLLSVNAVAYSTNGQHLISGSSDCNIQIWDAKTGATFGCPVA